MASGSMPFATQAGIAQHWIDNLGETPKVSLFTGSYVPDANSTFAAVDALKPSGTWYAAQTAVFGQVFREDNLAVRAEVLSVEFNYTGSSAPETITGYSVNLPSAQQLLFARRLDAPKVMGDSFDSLIVAPGVDFAPINAS